MTPSNRTLVTFDLAGSTHNQKILKELMKEYGTNPIPCEVIPEVSNPFDSCAVAVRVAGTIIGYVPKNDTETWHDYFQVFGDRFEGTVTLRDHGVCRAMASIWVA